MQELLNYGNVMGDQVGLGGESLSERVGGDVFIAEVVSYLLKLPLDITDSYVE